MWGISSIAPEFVAVVFGPKWALSVLPLQVLTFVLPVRMIASFVMSAVSGVGRFDLMLQNTVWVLAVGTPLFFAGAYWGGLTGLSLAWLFIPIFISVPSLIRAAPAIGLNLGQLLAPIKRPAAAALIMYLTVIATRYFLVNGAGEVLRLFILVAMGAAAYCAASFVLNRRSCY